MRIILLIFPLILLPAANAFSAPAGLYTGEVLVENQQRSERNRVLPLALKQVLQKLSGKGSFDDYPLVEPLLDSAASIVVSFHYANVESALADRPYTVFNGHVHSYQYLKRHGRDYVRLATTGGVQDADKELSIDHVTMVTVSKTGVDIANLRLSGIFDKKGKIPADGETLCFAAAICGEKE